MTTFCIVRPSERLVHMADHPTLNDALLAAGLKPREVDHGVVLLRDDGGGLSVMVDEWSLLNHAREGEYWSLGGRLYNGPAVLYVWGQGGETLNMRSETVEQIKQLVQWIGTSTDVEAAIKEGQAERPIQSINGQVVWQWTPT